MKKIEMIWREILFSRLEKGIIEFTQKELAEKFGFSTSTVSLALSSWRQSGAVKVTGRNFRLIDPKKALYHWASQRNLAKDILYQTWVALPIQEIENSLPPQAIYAAYSAYTKRFSEAPADYDVVYFYLSKDVLSEVKKRFPKRKGTANLVTLTADQHLSRYGALTTLSQTFVDLWNLPQWFARDFYLALEEKIDGLLA